MQWTNETGRSTDLPRPIDDPDPRLSFDPRAEHAGAKESLYLLYLRMVGTISRSYRGRGLSDHDLLVHAERGLRDAVATYDPSNFIGFSTHATWWIKQRLKEALLTAAVRGGPSAPAV